MLSAYAAVAVQPYAPTITDPLRDHARWQKLPEFDGIEPRSMVEDGSGVMWFGVAGAVVCYDGLNWRKYSTDDGLDAGRVNTLRVGPAGSMVAATDNGLFRLRGERWERLSPTQPERRTPSADVICGKDGALWAAHGKGILLITPGARTYFTQDGQATLPDTHTVYAPAEIPFNAVVQSVFEDAEGMIWCGLASGELIRFDPGAPDPSSADAWTVMSALPGFRRSYGYVCFQHPDGRVWVGGDHHETGLNCFDAGTNAWTYIDLPGMFGTDGIVRSLLQTTDGAMWAAGFGKLFRYKDGRWQSYLPPDVPLSSSRLSLLESRSRDLWVLGVGDDVQRIDFTGRRWRRHEGLNFQCETPDGRQWFLSIDNGIVCHDGKAWLRYGTEDGVMSAPTTLLLTQKGELWAVGAQDDHASAARWNGLGWERIHSRVLETEFSSVIDYRAVAETPDGSLWFGAYVNGRGGGILQYDPKKGPPENADAWVVHNAPGNEYSFGFSVAKDGSLYSGSYRGLFRFNGQSWHRVEAKEIDALAQSTDGEVWVGTRGIGLLRYGPGGRVNYTMKDGVRANAVTALFIDRTNHVWVGTSKGISHFDGTNWVTDVFPGSALAITREGGGFRQSADGAIWINQSSREWMRRTLPGAGLPDTAVRGFSTIRYHRDSTPPKTLVVTAPQEVSQPGNTAISWRAVDPWRQTSENDIHYSHRLDGGPWSGFSSATSQVLLAVPAGRHIFEVRARDRDLNIEREPARAEFVVQAPVWRQRWFITLVTLLSGGIAAQTFRLFRREQRLRSSNRSLFREVQERRRVEDTLRAKTCELEGKTAELEDEIEERRTIQSELQRQKLSLEAEIDERKRMEREVEKTQQELMLASHQAGMAEVAIGVLHSIGNVLNSINVSATVAEERLRTLKPEGLTKVSEMLEGNAARADYLSSDEKGRLLPNYLRRLADLWTAQRETALKEVAGLRHNIEYVKEIVATQQSYARFSGLVETVRVSELVEAAIRMNADALSRHAVELVRDYRKDGTVEVERNKVLQILVNLLQNAKNACAESEKSARMIVVRLHGAPDSGYVITVSDNGIGIHADDMPRLFNHGFTTRKHGHGFGLHSSANAAKALGGTLSAQSAGRDQGATFTLELPARPAQHDTGGREARPPEPDAGLI